MDSIDNEIYAELSYRVWLEVAQADAGLFTVEQPDLSPPQDRELPLQQRG